MVTLPGEGFFVGYSRVGALPVAGAVLDAAPRGVSPGASRSSGGEAAPVSSSASHPAHGAARAAGPPRASRPPRTCKGGSVRDRNEPNWRTRPLWGWGSCCYLHGEGEAFPAAHGAASRPSCCSSGPSSA